MFDYCHYVPLLKGKQGEYQALDVLSEEDKLQITPLLEIPFLPWDHRKGSFAKTYDQHLKNVAKLIERSWGVNRPLFLDLYYAEEGHTTTDGRHPLTYVMNDARMRGLKLVPVTGLERSVDYHKAVRDAFSTDRAGTCLRLRSQDITNLRKLHVELTELLAYMKSTPDHVDL